MIAEVNKEWAEKVEELNRSYNPRKIKEVPMELAVIIKENKPVICQPRRLSPAD